MTTTTTTTTTHGHKDDGHDDENHHHHHQEEEEDDGILCLPAIIPEDGKTISIWDVSGTVQSFSYHQGKNHPKGGAQGGGDVRNMCFSSHHHHQDGTTLITVPTDDLLTPCLDEAGNHGMPEEGCFCGIDIPHLHAHVHDPKVCNNNNNNNSNNKNEKAGTKKEKKKNGALLESNLMKLASLTLLPVDIINTKDNNNEDDNEHDTKEKSVGGEKNRRQRILQIPVSEHMPNNNCTSKDLLLLAPTRNTSCRSETTMYPVQVSF